MNFSIRTHLGRTEWWQRFTAWLDSPEGKLLAELETYTKTESKVSIPEVPIDPNNIKEQDRKKILDFMKGRAEVMVHDIIENSGANRLRVYDILFEEEQRGHIYVIQSIELGAPEIVSIKNVE